VRSSATSAEKNINFLIEHQCPQCGAPAVLDETDRLFTCEFCRVRSYLQPKSYFRYILPNSAPPGKQLVYFPYWRFKGTLISCIAAGLEHRFIDVSHQAIQSAFFPVSVGLRSQALKLKFVSPEVEGTFFKPAVSLEQTIEMLEKRFVATMPQPVAGYAHVGDMTSLIYSPFYIEDKIYDAILNQPVSPLLPGDFDAAELKGGRADWHIDFMPALCPECGWDMEGRKDSLVLNCKNCNSVWEAVKNGYRKLKFAYFSESGGSLRYLPFWRLKADIKGIQLKSYADLIKIANLPKVAQEGWEKIPFCFWIPAFKVKPKKFISLSTNFTLAQPREKMIQELPDAPLHPVTLPVQEAIESLMMNIASFLKPKRSVPSMLPEIDIQAKSFALIYVPFIEKHHDLVQPLFRQAVNKNMLALIGKNL
jgi:ribosomal protein L37AE/L43A